MDGAYAVGPLAEHPLNLFTLMLIFFLSVLGDGHVRVRCSCPSLINRLYMRAPTDDLKRPDATPDSTAIIRARSAGPTAIPHPQIIRNQGHKLRLEGGSPCGGGDMGGMLSDVNVQHEWR